MVHPVKHVHMRRERGGGCIRLPHLHTFLREGSVQCAKGLLLARNENNIIGAKNNQSKQTNRNETNREGARERTREIEKQSPESKREKKERPARNDKETHVSTDLASLKASRRQV